MPLHQVTPVVQQQLGHQRTARIPQANGVAAQQLAHQVVQGAGGKPVGPAHRGGLPFPAVRVQGTYPVKAVPQPVAGSVGFGKLPAANKQAAAADLDPVGKFIGHPLKGKATP